MKIGIIGASGKAGSQILKEAIRRSHEVTAIVRNPEKITEKEAAVIKKDLFDIKAADLRPYDAIVNASRPADGEEHLHVDAARIIIHALQGAPDTRLIAIGGAGSLFIDDEKSTQLMETPDFPSSSLPIARSQSINLDDLFYAEDITWTVIVPAASFNPDGRRTGTYESGENILLKNSKGNSYISYEDFAIAVLDEIEAPKHINDRFTVVGEE